MQVSIYPNVYARRPRMERWTWPQFSREMELRRVPDREGVPLWSPCTYPPEATRKAAAVERVDALTLDIDAVDEELVAQWGGQYTLERAFWHFKGYARLLHTTWSHRLEAPRFRLVIPLAEPVPGPLWVDAWKWAVAQLPEWLRPDEACKDPSRMFWMPAAPMNAAGHRVMWLDGPRLGIDLGLVRADKARQEAERQAKLRALRRPTRPPSKSAERRLERHRLQHDPDLRERLGLELGGRKAGEGAAARIVGIPCPGCGRPDVWFPLSPLKKGAASCNHKNTCGWWGWLGDAWTAAS